MRPKVIIQCWNRDCPRTECERYPHGNLQGHPESLMPCLYDDSVDVPVMIAPVHRSSTSRRARRTVKVFYRKIERHFQI